MNDGKCFFPLHGKAREAVKLQLLCEIKSAIASLAAAASALPTVLDIPYEANKDIDLDYADYQMLALTGDISFDATLNRPPAGSAKAVAIIIDADASDRTFTFNANWTPIGTTPTGITASKRGVLSITALGPDETDVIYAYLEEE